MKFKDYLGPHLFSRTFQAWKMIEKFKDFQGPVRTLENATPSRWTDSDHVKLYELTLKLKYG